MKNVYISIYLYCQRVRDQTAAVLAPKILALLIDLTLSSLSSPIVKVFQLIVFFLSNTTQLVPPLIFLLLLKTQLPNDVFSKPFHIYNHTLHP